MGVVAAEGVYRVRAANKRNEVCKVLDTCEKDVDARVEKKRKTGSGKGGKGVGARGSKEAGEAAGTCTEKKKPIEAAWNTARGNGTSFATPCGCSAVGRGVAAGGGDCRKADMTGRCCCKSVLRVAQTTRQIFAKWQQENLAQTAAAAHELRSR